MSYAEVPDCRVPPPHERCEAMTKEAPNEHPRWRREPHRCVRRAKQSRDGRSVCSTHARVDVVTYCDPDAADTFRHKRFWRWPLALSKLAHATSQREPR